MTRAFAETCEIENAFDGIPLPGRTDSMILGDALARCGLSGQAGVIERFQATYYRVLADELGRLAPTARVLPGVEALLPRLAARPSTTLALLTGNFSPAAQLKLTHFGIWSWFAFGAFGEDAPDRNGLVAVAVARGRANGLSAILPSDVVVIGDTPLDVECGRVNGARTLAVATGGTPAGRLAEAGADLVLDDLSDTDRVLAFLDSYGAVSA
jgi:phosphoglycolate phosphatase